MSKQYFEVGIKSTVQKTEVNTIKVEAKSKVEAVKIAMKLEGERLDKLYCDSEISGYTVDDFDVKEIEL